MAGPRCIHVKDIILQGFSRWANEQRWRVVQTWRFRAVRCVRGQKCERCAIAGRFDCASEQKRATDAGSKTGFAALKAGFGSDPRLISTTLGFLSTSWHSAKRNTLENTLERSRSPGAPCSGAPCEQGTEVRSRWPFGNTVHCRERAFVPLLADDNTKLRPCPDSKVGAYRSCISDFS